MGGGLPQRSTDCSRAESSLYTVFENAAMFLIFIRKNSQPYSPTPTPSIASLHHLGLSGPGRVPVWVTWLQSQGAFIFVLLAPTFEQKSTHQPPPLCCWQLCRGHVLGATAGHMLEGCPLRTLASCLCLCRRHPCQLSRQPLLAGGRDPCVGNASTAESRVRLTATPGRGRPAAPSGSVDTRVLGLLILPMPTCPPPNAVRVCVLGA